jgi:membrane protease YdiL (CAAX protease family)
MRLLRAIAAAAATIAVGAPRVAAQPSEPTVGGGPPSATPDVFSRAADPRPEVRAGAVVELAASPEPRALHLVTVIAQGDVAPSVRIAAVEALASTSIGAMASVVDEISRRDPDRAVRDAARRAYRRLAPFRKRPGSAAGLSILCPGCGHFYLGERGAGAAYLATTAALLGTGIALLSEGGSPEIDDFATDSNDPIGLLLLSGGQNVWFTAIFDAYRDARLARGNHGYDLPITSETLGDLASAPFRPRVLASPWVWAGVPLAVAAGIGLLSLVEDDEVSATRTLFDGGGVNFLGRRFSTGAGFALGELYYGGLFVPVAVGEEALFRGTLQSALSESLGVWGGWATASLLFGAAHIGNFSQPGTDLTTAAVAIPFITAVGSGLGLAYIQTEFRLETSVAMHFWYDFLLGSVYFVADPDSQPFVVRVVGAF